MTFLFEKRKAMPVVHDENNVYYACLNDDKGNK